MDWSLLSFPSMSLLNFLCLCHSTVWDFLLFILLQCINVLQHSLSKAALEEWGSQLLGTTLQRGFSSYSGQVDSTCTSSETSSSPLGCCSPQAQSISKWQSQTSCWSCIVLPCRVVQVHTPLWCFWQLVLLHHLPSHSSPLIPVGYPAVLCGEAPHGHQHSHPSGLRQVPGWWLWVSLLIKHAGIGCSFSAWLCLLSVCVCWEKMGVHGLTCMRKEGKGSPLLASCFFYLGLGVEMGQGGRKEMDSSNFPLTLARGKHAEVSDIHMYLLFSV